MDTKNVIAAISLSAAVIILYGLFFAPPPQEIKRIQEEKKQVIESTETPSLEINEKVSKISREEAINENERINFENQNIIGSISLMGAIIDDLTFKKYTNSLNGNDNVILLNPRALALSASQGGIGLTINDDLTSTAGIANNSALFQSIQLAQTFSLNSEETITSDYIFVRIGNQDFNYTTNPSMISGSGEFVYSSLINNPQTFITTVGLYNDTNELLSVAKLSKPLVKDFTKEALIRVKLDF